MAKSGHRNSHNRQNVHFSGAVAQGSTSLPPVNTPFGQSALQIPHFLHHCSFIWMSALGDCPSEDCIQPLLESTRFSETGIENPTPAVTRQGLRSPLGLRLGRGPGLCTVLAVGAPHGEPASHLSDTTVRACIQYTVLILLQTSTRFLINRLFISPLRACPLLGQMIVKTLPVNRAWPVQTKCLKMVGRAVSFVTGETILRVKRVVLSH